MADPLTLTVLGTVAATEGIKFLYGQASEILMAWRDRRAQGGKVDVPILDTAILDASPSDPAVDMDVVALEKTALTRLVSALHPYATGLDDVEETNEELARNAGDLRALLEAAYGQRLTFAGEDREPTGSRVDVRQTLGSVSGLAVGVEADLRSGEVSVAQRVDKVQGDGTIVGFKGSIGS